MDQSVGLEHGGSRQLSNEGLCLFFPVRMKRPLDEQEEDESMIKRQRGEGPKVELRILLQSKVTFNALFVSSLTPPLEHLGNWLVIVTGSPTKHYISPIVNLWMTTIVLSYTIHRKSNILFPLCMFGCQTAVCFWLIELLVYSDLCNLIFVLLSVTTETYCFGHLGVFLEPCLVRPVLNKLVWQRPIVFMVPY